MPTGPQPFRAAERQRLRAWFGTRILRRPGTGAAVHPLPLGDHRSGRSAGTVSEQGARACALGFAQIVQEGVLEPPVGAHVDDSPLAVGPHRLLVPAAEVPDAVRVLQVVQFRRILAVLPVVELDRPPVLLAALDQPLFLDAQRLHRHPRQAQRQTREENRRRREQRQQGVPALAAPSGMQ